MPEPEERRFSLRHIAFAIVILLGLIAVLAYSLSRP
jgi:hypothetical protein